MFNINNIDQTINLVNKRELKKNFKRIYNSTKVQCIEKFFTENKQIVDNLLMSICNKYGVKIKEEDKNELISLYSYIVTDYLNYSDFDGKENDIVITDTSVKIIDYILTTKYKMDLNEEDKREFLTINSIIKQVYGYLF
tara:strand:+ start:7828 stop:8244 length:417 start_codon:yes stop_codon:yes gene_type:complete